MISLFLGLTMLVVIWTNHLRNKDSELRDAQNTTHRDMTALLCKQLNSLRDRVDELEKMK